MIRSCTTLRWLAASLFASAMLLACGGGDDDDNHHHGMSYVATSLVTDVNDSSNPYSVSNVDPLLVNSWGIAFNPQGFVWVANAGTSTSTLYDGNGVPQSLIVDIPPGSAGSASPTGIVFNGSSDFVVSQGGASGASAFIFVGEAGTVSGWSPSVNLNAAVKVADRGAAGAIYKGLTLSGGGGNFLYATDFHNGTVDVFDASFNLVTAPGGFVDPNLPAGYAPFGIRDIGGDLYVTYAVRDSTTGDEVASAGLGIVDVFDTNGNLLRRLAGPGGALNAPWGLALVPAGFGAFEGDLLVGNFGDGTINAFDPATGTFLGTLRDAHGNPFVNDGLWGLQFGNGGAGGLPNVLYLTAGINDERDGLFAAIHLPEPGTLALVGVAVVGIAFVVWRRHR